MLKEMTPKERINAAFAGEPIDHIPVTPFLEGGVWLMARENMSFNDLYKMDDLGVNMIVDAFLSMKSDLVMCGLGCWLGWLEAIGCPIDMNRIGSPIEMSPCFIDVAKNPPLLDKSSIRAQLENSELVQKMMQQTREIKKSVAQTHHVVFPIVAPFSAVSIMVGMNELMLLLAEAPEVVPDLCDYAVECCSEMANMACENGADIVLLSDPVASANLISLAMYEKFAAPYLDKVLEKIDKCDDVLLHICGKALDRIPSIKQMKKIKGFSIDSVIDLKQALDAAGQDLIIIGNVDPIGIMLQGTAEDVYRETYKCAEIAGMDGRLFLMPGCDLAAGTKEENILAMTKASLDYAAKASAK